MGATEGTRFFFARKDKPKRRFFFQCVKDCCRGLIVLSVFRAKDKKKLAYLAAKTI